MPDAYMGKLLRIDLTTSTVKHEMLPAENVLRKYIAGLGLAAKILYEEVPLQAKPLDPENRLIFMTGPLTGTTVPCANNCSVVSLSYDTPYTLGVGHFHGVFGPILKWAGYDGIVVQGASPEPVYLWVSNGQVEIRDASHLWGKDTHETCDIVRQEVREPQAAVASIGPAGENLCGGAGVCTAYHNLAAKGGTGAVMGAKKLKAIAVWGTRGIRVNSPDRLLEVSLEWRTKEEGILGLRSKMGPAPVTKGWFSMFGQRSLTAFKNLSDPEGGSEMGRVVADMLARSTMRAQACFSCPLACCYRVEIPDGPHKGYVATPGGGGENLEGAGGLMGITEPGTLYWLVDQFDRMGWDSGTPGLAMALAFELYERGIISKRETDGLELKWGNADAVYQLMQKMIKGEGIGKVLAQGPKATADHFGGDAHKYVAHIKGTGFNLHDWRPMWGEAFSYAVSSAGPCHEGGGFELFPETDLGYADVLPWPGTEGKVEAVRRGARRKLWNDSVGVCMLAFLGTPDVSNLSSLALAAATGWHDFSKEEAWEVGERVLNLMRMFSVRRGHTPEHDLDLGQRLLEAPASGVGKGQTFAPHLKEMLTEYYTLMGWDPDIGKPKLETLERLGLEGYYSDIADIEIAPRVQDIRLPGEIKSPHRKKDKR